MVAIPLIHGRLTANDYEDKVAEDPEIDVLREKMQVTENKSFSIDYMDPEKRAIGNSVQVFFNDGSKTERLAIDYPVGHRRRREEGIPLLIKKFENSLLDHFDPQQAEKINKACSEQQKLESIMVKDFVDLWVK